MLKFLKKHIKATGCVIAVITLGAALLAGATPFVAILVSLTLAFFSVTAIKKTEKSAVADLPPDQDRLPSVPTIAPPPSHTRYRAPLEDQVARVENQGAQALTDMNRKTQEAQAQREANIKAAQQKIEAMREKYAAAQKDLEKTKA